jgi:alcohol dehydrogenase
MGFHVDGFARDLINHAGPAGGADAGRRQLRDAACAPSPSAPCEHMLFDNAKLEARRNHPGACRRLRHRHIAIKMAKAIGCTVITTVGDDAKAEKAKALGADHVINYREDRFEGVTRKLTGKKGVDVVFEHVGADTFNGSLLSPEARRTAGDLRLDLGPQSITST